MAYLTLPRQTDDIYKHLHYSANDAIPVPVISRSLHDYLLDIQSQIYLRSENWDLYSTYTNPYEFLCNSQSTEIVTLPNFNIIEILGTFCPVLPPRATITGLSISKESLIQSVPAQYTYIDTIPSNVGELCKDVLDNAVTRWGSAIDIIVAELECNTETANAARSFGQVAYALSLQNRGGIFIMKLTDCFNMHTLDILYLLSSLYEKVHIMKPNATRCATSEKYAVCIGFVPDSIVAREIYPYIARCFDSVVSRQPGEYIHRFLDIRIPHYVLGKIEEINAVFGQQQLEHIQSTIALIDNKRRDAKIQTLAKQHTYKCEQWFAKYRHAIFSTMHISPTG